MIEHPELGEKSTIEHLEHTIEKLREEKRVLTEALEKLADAPFMGVSNTARCALQKVRGE